MKLARSDSPEVTHSIASTGALACWGWSVLTFVCIASAPGLLIVLVASLTFSVRLAVELGVPLVLAMNGYLFWRGRSPRLNWVIAVCPDRVFIRLFVQRWRGRADIQEPDVMMFEASEIASMKVRIADVFLYGPKPKSVELVVIEPALEIAQGFSAHMRPLLNADNPGKQIYVTNEEGRLAMDWRVCRPELRTFLQEVARECPAVVIAPEERSEVDLNNIWNNTGIKLNAQQRRMLIQAKRLGFGENCVRLLSIYKRMSFREAREYLSKIEREDTGIESPAGCLRCRF